ncbi:20047_t:CDS:2, partial [Entrophospora sp. SA101]
GSYGAMVNYDGFSRSFLFGRITKVTVPALFNDRGELCDYLDLLWTFKIKLQETTEKIDQLRLDHISNKFNPSSKDPTDLIPFQPHIPQKDKDKKGVGATRPTSLPHGTKNTDQARECKKYVVDAEYRVRGFLKQTNSQGVVILSFY